MSQKEGLQEYNKCTTCTGTASGKAKPDHGGSGASKNGLQSRGRGPTEKENTMGKRGIKPTMKEGEKKGIEGATEQKGGANRRKRGNILRLEQIEG